VESFGNIPSDIIDNAMQMLKPVTNYVETYAGGAKLRQAGIVGRGRATEELTILRFKPILPEVGPGQRTSPLPSIALAPRQSERKG
jgi:hypothetical protein